MLYVAMPRCILALIDFSVFLQITITTFGRLVDLENMGMGNRGRDKANGAASSLGLTSGINTWQTGRQLTWIKLRGRFHGHAKINFFRHAMNVRPTF